MITLDVLNQAPGIRHAFFTREGGVSSGLFESLNCGFGSGDAAETVGRNRAIGMERLGFSDLQAQAILDLQLRRLAALERQKITDEYEGIIKLMLLKYPTEIKITGITG